jgi:hypothetical protein
MVLSEQDDGGAFMWAACHLDNDATPVENVHVVYYSGSTNTTRMALRPIVSTYLAFYLFPLPFVFGSDGFACVAARFAISSDRAVSSAWTCRSIATNASPFIERG